MSPAVEGMLATSITMAKIKLRSCKSFFENNCLIPKRAPLKQSSLAFKIHRLYVHPVASHLERQFDWDARCESGFHCFQLISSAAKSAKETAAGADVTLAIHGAASAGVESSLHPSC